MPAHRKSLAELRLSGTLLKNPGRYAKRLDSPAVAPIGYAPKSLSTEEKEIWRQMLNTAAPGTLGRPDEFMLELACRLIAQSRTPDGLKPGTLGALVGILERLGFSPASRARLTASAPPQPAPEEDVWGQFDRPAKPNGVQ